MRELLRNKIILVFATSIVVLLGVFLVRSSFVYGASSQAESDYQNDTQLDDELDAQTQTDMLQNEQVSVGQIVDTTLQQLSIQSQVSDSEKEESSTLVLPEETVIPIKPEIQQDQTTDEIDQIMNSSIDAQDFSDATGQISNE